MGIKFRYKVWVGYDVEFLVFFGLWGYILLI